VRAPSEPGTPPVSQESETWGAVTVSADFWRAVASLSDRRRVYFLRVQPQSGHIGMSTSRRTASGVMRVAAAARAGSTT
jgi:hypothetical protein